MNLEQNEITQGIERPYLSDFGKYSVVLLLVSLATLVPSFLVPLASAPSKLPVQVIVHGIAFLSWYILVTVQSGLASSKRITAHKRLGSLSIFFAAFLIVSGASMLYGTMNSYDPNWTEQHLASRTSFVWAILHTLIFFSSSYILAIHFRKDRQTHKRLILLASLSMIAPSITRVAYLPLIPIDGTAFTLLATYFFLAIPFFIDRREEESVHPVTKYGIPIYAITQIVALGVIPATAFGREFAFFL